MFFSALTLAALALFPAALAEGNITGLAQALNQTGLDLLANATRSLNGTILGRYVLSQLASGEMTIFGPTDAALSAVSPSILNNQTSLADIIAYHIVRGNFVNSTATYPNVTIGRTLLNDSSLVALEGNQSQVLVWSKDNNGTLFVENQGANYTVVNSTTYEKTAILAIDTVLIPPPNISTLLSNSSYPLSSVASLVNSTALPNGPSLLDVASSAHGITIFAPDNSGIQAAQSTLSGLSGNTTALGTVLANHVINGTTVYSTEMSNSSRYVSAAGQDTVFSVNDTGLFVSVGGSNQVQIVQADVLTSNGVVQIVNGVMDDTNSNAAAASSAFASATSMAGHTTQSGPVALPTTTHVSSAMKGEVNNWKLGILAGLIIGLKQLA